MSFSSDNSLFLRVMEGLIGAFFFCLELFFKGLGWVFDELPLVIGLALCLALAVFAWRILHGIISLPMQRRERARMFLALLESGTSGGPSVERLIIRLSHRHEQSMGPEFHLLAAHLEQGLPLMAALDKVPRLLPPSGI